MAEDCYTMVQGGGKVVVVALIEAFYGV